MKKLLIIPLLLPLLAVIYLYVRSTGTRLQLQPAPKAIARATPFAVRVENPHGIRRLTVSVLQNGTEYPVHHEEQPATRFGFFRTAVAPRKVPVEAGLKKVPQLKSGKATLIVRATSNDLAAEETSLRHEVQVITEPPRVVADGFQHYINQGGSELVVFNVSGYWTEAGVRVGPYTFRSFPHPDGTDGKRFSLFAFPWDVAANTTPVVYVRNPAGQESTATFWFKVFPKKFRSRDLDLSDNFLQKVTGQIPSQGSTLLEKFLSINRGLREKNNQTLAALAGKTAEQFLWKEPFVQLANSKVESLFADKRSYFYQGKLVDEQVHLGFDLSVTQNVDVTAANDGKVVHAGDLGIYGNCIVVDHGYGLQSIYAHLQQIGVKEGDMVKRGQSMGKSGSTGLAGGDHLHFSMQVGGVQINPVEWWDAHWIQDRVASKVPLGK